MCICDTFDIYSAVILCIVATEAHDDDGLPHTLEHLIFLGSDDYPFKAICAQFYEVVVVYGTLVTKNELKLISLLFLAHYACCYCADFSWLRS